MVQKKTTKSSKAAPKKTNSHKAKIIYDQSQRKKDYFFPVLLLVVALIIIGFVSNGTFFLGGFSHKQTIPEGNQTVLVTVNSEPIYQSELDEYWDQIPTDIKLQLTKEDLLEEFIQERLLLQEADKKGISVTDTEVDQYITSQLSSAGLTLEQFQTILSQQGTSLDRMRDIYQRQLKLAKLFEEQSKDLDATDEEVQTYYTEHKTEFFRPEQVTVRHILIPVNDNINDSTAQERVAELEASLDAADNENFCDLVSNYSGDPGSINNCGEYTFSKGEMVQEFEDAGFDMDIGERRTVKTSFGYHIMIKDAVIPAGYLSLEDDIGGQTLDQAIRQLLAQEKAKAIYDAYIKDLKEKSTIIYEAANDPREDTKNVVQDSGNVTIDNQDVVVEIN
ncbi:MAG: peptidylprolyl isomerase [Nanoarchaeota archaeon]|nr:peptidylprolyl isomerase [Nanoarchaeota archaeon]